MLKLWSCPKRVTWWLAATAIAIALVAGLAGPRAAAAAGLTLRVGLGWDRWAVEVTGAPVAGIRPAPGAALWPASPNQDPAPEAVVAGPGTYRLASAAPTVVAAGTDSSVLARSASVTAMRTVRFSGTTTAPDAPAPTVKPAKIGSTWYCRLSDGHLQSGLSAAGWPHLQLLWPTAPGRTSAFPTHLCALALTGEGRGLVHPVAGAVSVQPRVPGEWVRHAGKPYRGRLEILVAGSLGLLSVVNHVDMEDYLLGVVPSEMPASWPLEALKAQAVAARTYAASNLGRHARSGFDLCFDIHCQAYGGVAVEHAATSTAVRQTAGLVATYGGRLINAVYHAHAGGATDSSRVIWGSAEPYLVGTTRTYERPYHWTISNSRREVERVVARHVSDLPDGLFPVLELVPHTFTAGGRATRVTVEGAAATSQITANQLRNSLGTYRLRSGNFTATPVWVAAVWEATSACGGLEAVLPVVTWVPGAHGTGVLVWQQQAATGGPPNGPGQEAAATLGWLEPSFFVFAGEGFGHGVGMSQWGAREMAVQGFDYRAILTNFYAGVSLTSNYGR